MLSGATAPSGRGMCFPTHAAKGVARLGPRSLRMTPLWQASGRFLARRSSFGGYIIKRGWHGLPTALPFEWSDPMILQDLVDELGGTLVQGDPEWMVDGVNSCEKAGAFDVAFAESDATVAAAFSGNAGVVVLKPGAAKEYPHGKCIVEVGPAETVVCQGGEACQEAFTRRGHCALGRSGSRCEGRPRGSGWAVRCHRDACAHRRWDHHRSRRGYRRERDRSGCTATSTRAS